MMIRLICKHCLSKKYKKYILPLTSDVEEYILNANDETLCFKTIHRAEEECLRSKMTKKSVLNITMIVWQLERWRRHIRFWSPSTSLYPHQNLKLAMVIIPTRLALKREI